MAAPAAGVPVDHQFIVVRGHPTPVHTTALTPVQVGDVRAAEVAGEVTCPTCGGPMRLVTLAGGPVAEHVGENQYAAHEPEDPQVRQSKHLLARHLRTLFPSGTVSLDIPVPEAGRLADLVMVTPMGGRVAVEFQSTDLSREGVLAVRNGYVLQGIGCLWVLDGRRLSMTKKGGIVRGVTLNQLETSLTALGEPLIYLDGSRVVWVRPSPVVRQLAELGDKRIGRAECLVHIYRLGQLHIKQAQWWADTRYDKRPPAPGSLPQNLQKRLEKLQAKQQSA